MLLTKTPLDFIAYTFLGFSLEPCSGIICACLPIIAPLFKDFSFRNLRRHAHSPMPQNSSHTMFSSKIQTPGSISDPFINNFHKIHDNASSQAENGSIGLEDLVVKPDVCCMVQDINRKERLELFALKVDQSTTSL